MVKPIYEPVKRNFSLFFVFTNDNIIMGRGKNIGAKEYWERYTSLAGPDTKDLAVALFAGVTTSTLSSWKIGCRYPPVNVAIKIAEYFHVPVEAFFNDANKHNFENNRLLSLAKKYKSVLDDLETLDQLTLETVKVQIRAVANASINPMRAVAEQTQDYSAAEK